MTEPKVVLYNPRADFYTLPLALLALASSLPRNRYRVRIVDGRLEDVKRRWGTDTIRVDAAGDPAAVARHPGVAEAREMGRTVEVRLREGQDPSAFLADIARAARVQRFEVRAPSLHSIFVRLVSGDGSGADAPAGETAGAAPAGGTS